MTHASFDGTGMAAASGRQRSPLRRVLSGMHRSCERHAARVVQAHLLAPDDATLALIGLDRQALQRDIASGSAL